MLTTNKEVHLNSRNSLKRSLKASLDSWLNFFSQLNVHLHCLNINLVHIWKTYMTSFGHGVTLSWQYEKTCCRLVECFHAASILMTTTLFTHSAVLHRNTHVWHHMLRHRTNSPAAITHHRDGSLNHLHPEAGNKQIRYRKQSEVGAYWWMWAKVAFHAETTRRVWTQMRKLSIALL